MYSYYCTVQYTYYNIHNTFKGTRTWKKSNQVTIFFIPTKKTLLLQFFAGCETVYEEHEVEEDIANCVTELTEVCNTNELGEVIAAGFYYHLIYRI